MIILGIDPGVASVGYGVVEEVKNKNQKVKTSLKCLDYGVIKTKPSLSQSERLKKINEGVKALIKKFQPRALAVENVYFFKNLKTALPVSQAKGVIMLAAAEKKIPVYEFTPPRIKMAVTGYGRADKRQIQKMVQILFNLKEMPKPDDAADALATAFCCFMRLKSDKMIRENIF